ncbi:uncharacterized protein LOC111113080 isoform X1 [Crassostrea virginica]
MMSTSSRGRRRARRPSAAAGSAAQEMAQASEHPLTDSTSDSGQPQLVEEVTQRVLQALAEVNQKGKKRSQGRQGANSKKKRQRTPSTSGGEISGFSTIHGEISNYHTKEIPKCLEDTASRLLEAAVSQNTHQSYRTAMSVFQKYHQCTFSTSPKFPTTVSQVIYFVAWLHQQGKSYNTINTYLAGLSYYHQVNAFTDPTQFFVVKRLIKGVQHLSSKPDIRLPITPQILQQLVEALKYTVSGRFNRCLLKAMFTLSFFAFLRVGEVSAKCRSNVKNVIRMENLVLDEPLKNAKYMTLTLRHFKHNDSCRPVCLHIALQKCKSICPVRAMIKYIKARGSGSGPLFTFDGYSPITQSYFTSELKNTLCYVGLDPKLYKSHSFRIGAASYAFHSKIPEDKIRLMGRWNSSAVRRYFRIPVFDSIDISP